MNSFYTLLFLTLFDITLIEGKPLDCQEVCRNKSLRHWLKLCACETTASLSGTKKYDLEGSDIFYEPADTLVVEPSSFLRPPFLIINPTKFTKIKVSQSGEQDDNSAIRDTPKKPRNILQENLSNSNKIPIYSYLDVGLKENITLTDGNKQQDIEQIEKNLKECLDLHILVLTRNSKKSLETKKDLKTGKFTENESMSDSDIFKALQSKCSEPLQLMENSIDGVQVRLPKKKNTTLFNNSFLHLYGINNDNGTSKSQITSGLMNDDYEKVVQEKISNTGLYNIQSNLSSLYPTKNNDKELINNFIPVVGQESDDIDKFISTEQTLRIMNHITVSENNASLETNGLSSLYNSNNTSTHEHRINDHLEEVNADQTESNSSPVIAFEPLFSNPDAIINNEEKKGEQYYIAPSETKNVKFEEEGFQIKTSARSTLSNTTESINKEISISSELPNILKSVNKTESMEEFKKNVQQDFDLQNLESQTVNVEDIIWIARQGPTSNGNTSVNEVNQLSAGKSKAESDTKLNNIMELNIFQSIPNSQYKKVTNKKSLQNDDHESQTDDIVSKVSSIKMVKDDGTIITRHHVDEKDLKIPKIQTKEIENGTVVSSVTGTEKLPNNDFIDKKLKTTQEETVSGKLYFIFNNQKVPAWFIQDQTGKIRLGLDGRSLCEKLLSQNTNTTHSSSFLYKMCSS